MVTDDGGKDLGWTVWRQDDNGNRFVVAHHSDRSAADSQAAEMEARGHKQTYWVARRGGEGDQAAR